MGTIKNFSGLSESDFIQSLRLILDETLNRSSNQSISLDPQFRLQLEQLIRSTNPSSKKINFNDLPENLQKTYSNFIVDYRRDIERYHLQHASQHFDEYRLKNFDWNIRMVLHDEHLFKCRLPLVNLQLELTNEQTSKQVLLEFTEEELNQLIDQMTQIEQIMNNSNGLV